MSYFKKHTFRDVTVQPAYIIPSWDVKAIVRKVERWIENGCKPDGITPATGRNISEIFLSGSLAWPTDKEGVLKMHATHFGDAEKTYAVFNKFLLDRVGLIKGSGRWEEVKVAFEKYLKETDVMERMRYAAEQHEISRETDEFSRLLLKHPEFYFVLAPKFKVHLVDNNNGEGDWKGLYLNGELFTEGHSLDYPEILKHLAKVGAIEFKKTSYTDEQLQDEMSSHYPKQEAELIEGETKITRFGFNADDKPLWKNPEDQEDAK
jgi:hypothetical protein